MSDIVYAAQSRKTGSFFKFVKYTEDGWGKFEANADTWFGAKIWSQNARILILDGKIHLPEFLDHSDNEVAWVRISAKTQIE